MLTCLFLRNPIPFFKDGHQTVRKFLGDKQVFLVNIQPPTLRNVQIHAHYMLSSDTIKYIPVLCGHLDQIHGSQLRVTTFCPPGNIQQCLETVFIGATGKKGSCCSSIRWVEAKDAAKHPTMHTTAPHSKELSAQNINSDKVKKP